METLQHPTPQFQTVNTSNYRNVITPKNNTVNCPHCGSNNIHIRPAQYWQGHGRHMYIGKIPAYINCQTCGKTGKLTPQQESTLAKYIIETYPTHQNNGIMAAANEILQKNGDI